MDIRSETERHVNKICTILVFILCKYDSLKEISSESLFFTITIHIT